MAHKNNKGIFLKVAIIAAVVAVGFGIYAVANKSDTGSGELEKISLRLKWLDQAQFAGYYSANENGTYKNEGLDVDMQPGGPDISPMQMVMSGVNDFGVIGADQILLAREKGLPVVAVAVIYQHSSVSFASLTDKNITAPSDLKGKTVAIAYGRDEEIVYQAMLKNAGIDRGDIKEIPLMPGLVQLTSGAADVQMVYETNEPIAYQREGHEVNLIKARDYGVNFYADVLFTTEKTIKEKPHVVEKMVRASLDGWKQSFEDTGKASLVIAKQNKVLDAETQKKSLELSKPLIFNDGKIGLSSAKRWADMQDIMIEQGVMKKRVDVASAFTNRFVE